MSYPLFNYFFVCDSIEKNQSNQINVSNIFNQMRSNIYPFSREIVFVLGFLAIEETVDVAVTFMDEEGKVIKLYGEKFNINVEVGKVCTVAAKIPSVTFPKPGKYKVYFSINGQDMPYINNYLQLELMDFSDLTGVHAKSESTQIILKQLLDKHFNK